MMRQPEELQTRQSRQGTRAGRPRSEREQIDEDPFSSSESETLARSDEDIGGAKEQRMYPIFDQTSTRHPKSPQKTREASDRKSLSKEREQRSRSRSQGSKTRSQPSKKERVQDHSPQSIGTLLNQEEEQEGLERLCEIITTEATRKLDDVPKSARPVRNAAELRRLLEEINLSHLPRSQTKFVVWYQTNIGGVFYKEPVKSVHQSLKSAYFRLKSGTVLKFNRCASDKC